MLRAAYGQHGRSRNGNIALVMSSPQLIAAAPHSRQRARSAASDSDRARKSSRHQPLSKAARSRVLHLQGNRMHKNPIEPNAELAQVYEPLRIAFAVFALLLGALAAM